MSKMKKLPNSTMYIKPDVSREYSNCLLCLDIPGKQLFQFAFDDGQALRKFFIGNTKQPTYCYFGTRTMIPRPHKTLQLNQWNQNLEDIFLNLEIVTPLYDTERYPVVRHPVQQIYGKLNSPIHLTTHTEDIRTGPKYGNSTNIEIINVSFTDDRLKTCNGIECVSLKFITYIMNREKSPRIITSSVTAKKMWIPIHRRFYWFQILEFSNTSSNY